MIVVALKHPKQYEFLKHVFAHYTGSGLPPEELAIAADTYEALLHAQTIQPDLHMGKAEVKEAGPNGVVFEVAPEPVS